MAFFHFNRIPKALSSCIDSSIIRTTDQQTCMPNQQTHSLTPKQHRITVDATSTPRCYKVLCPLGEERRSSCFLPMFRDFFSRLRANSNNGRVSIYRLLGQPINRRVCPSSKHITSKQRRITVDATSILRCYKVLCPLGEERRSSCFLPMFRDFMCVALLDSEQTLIMAANHMLFNP